MMDENKVERVGKASGLRCVVLGIPNMHRCGYVGVRPGSVLYGKHYDDVPAEVHGGLTYSGGGSYPVDGDEWWLGFDCAHYGDAPDPALRDDRYRAPSHGCESSGHLWTSAEVAEECERLAAQIDEIERAEPYGWVRRAYRLARFWLAVAGRRCTALCRSVVAV